MQLMKTLNSNISKIVHRKLLFLIATLSYPDLLNLASTIIGWIFN